MKLFLKQPRPVSPPPWYSSMFVYHPLRSYSQWQSTACVSDSKTLSLLEWAVQHLWVVCKCRASFLMRVRGPVSVCLNMHVSVAAAAPECERPPLTLPVNVWYWLMLGAAVELIRGAPWEPGHCSPQLPALLSGPLRNLAEPPATSLHLHSSGVLSWRLIVATVRLIVTVLCVSAQNRRTREQLASLNWDGATATADIVMSVVRELLSKMQ